MNEDRILDKLDNIDQQTRELLVAVTRLEEQGRGIPERVAALERWRWAIMGALASSGLSLLTQLSGFLKGV